MYFSISYPESQGCLCKQSKKQICFRVSLEMLTVGVVGFPATVAVSLAAWDRAEWFLPPPPQRWSLQQNGCKADSKAQQAIIKWKNCCRCISHRTAGYREIIGLAEVIPVRAFCTSFCRSEGFCCSPPLLLKHWPWLTTCYLLCISGSTASFRSYCILHLLPTRGFTLQNKRWRTSQGLLYCLLYFKGTPVIVCCKVTLCILVTWISYKKRSPLSWRLFVQAVW